MNGLNMNRLKVLFVALGALVCLLMCWYFMFWCFSVWLFGQANVVAFYKAAGMMLLIISTVYLIVSETEKRSGMVNYIQFHDFNEFKERKEDET